MTNEEKRRWLECALDWLQQIKLDGDSEEGIALGSGICAIETALAALEPEPLAVVEVCALQVEGGPDYSGTIWIERFHEGNLYIGYECPETARVRPLTVTITERPDA